MTGLHSPCPALFELACKLRAKPMPPVPYGVIANIHASCMQKVFDISQRERKPHIKHNCKLDNIRAASKILKDIRLSMAQALISSTLTCKVV